MTGAEAVRPLARLERLSYWYPEEIRALAEVELDLKTGLTVVAGPSGGGKSSLLRVFNGLVPHFHGGRIAGAATVFGRDVLTTPTRTLAGEVGFVFQDPEQQVVYGTVEREIAFGLENLQVGREEMVRRVGEALERLGLTALRRRSVSTLSGGERQRLAIASVIAMRPRLVALDEPTSELDRSGAEAVITAALDLVAAGTAIVVAEHRLERLLPVAGRVIAIEDGRLAPGPPSVDRASGAQSRLANPSQPVARRQPPGGGSIAWSMRGVSAGPAGAPILECPDLSGRSGEVVAITGANGSGKTTLLRTLAGLLPALRGTVERTSGRIAYLPQDPGALLHRPTVLAEVAWTLRHARPDVPATDHVAEALAGLAEFGLAGLAERDPRDLSSGQRQRAALAVILAGGPAIALLDEPTRGMDGPARTALVAAIRRLQADGCSIVMATHDEQLVREAAGRVVAIADGALRELDAGDIGGAPAEADEGGALDPGRAEALAAAGR